MQEHKSITTGMARRALQSFGDGGQPVSNAQLYDALGLTAEQEKDRLRSRLGDLVRSGEAVKVKPGVYTYNTKYRPREGRACPAVWRFVRMAKPGWTLKECAIMTRVDYTQVLRYCAWLEEEGFIGRTGKGSGNANTYRATARAAATPETPWPPHRPTDPFAKERAAAASIVRIMLCADLYAAKTAYTITEAARVLLARFEKAATEYVTETENKEETSC